MDSSAVFHGLGFGALFTIILSGAIAALLALCYLIVRKLRIRRGELHAAWDDNSRVFSQTRLTRTPLLPTEADTTKLSILVPSLSLPVLPPLIPLPSLPTFSNFESFSLPSRGWQKECQKRWISGDGVRALDVNGVAEVGWQPSNSGPGGMTSMPNLVIAENEEIGGQLSEQISRRLQGNYPYQQEPQPTYRQQKSHVQNGRIVSNIPASQAALCADLRGNTPQRQQSVIHVPLWTDVQPLDTVVDFGFRNIRGLPQQSFAERSRRCQKKRATQATTMPPHSSVNERRSYHCGTPSIAPVKNEGLDISASASPIRIPGNDLSHKVKQHLQLPRRVVSVLNFPQSEWEYNHGHVSPPRLPKLKNPANSATKAFQGSHQHSLQWIISPRSLQRRFSVNSEVSSSLSISDIIRQFESD